MENSVNINFISLSHSAAILLTGLLAGVFYGYDCSVVKGLGGLSNETYLQSFQSINKAIQNPYFFASFMGCLLILPISSWLSFSSNNSFAFFLMLSATIIYFIGVFGVTIFCNVPLNEKLANFQIELAGDIEISTMRQIFEKRWNYYHTLRTIAAIISFTLTILSVTKQRM